MKTKHYILLAIISMLTFLSGLIIGKIRMAKPPGDVTETRETTVDTILYFAPQLQSELVLGTHRYTLPFNRIHGGGHEGAPRQCCENDSIYVDTLIAAHYGTGAGGTPRCSKDSAIAELPIIQRHYTDSTYEAWVSGPVEPRLDSVRVFAKTTVINRREWKPPKRWHIGPAIGLAYTRHGIEPYLGICLTYSIIDF